MPFSMPENVVIAAFCINWVCHDVDKMKGLFYEQQGKAHTNFDGLLDINRDQSNYAISRIVVVGSGICIYAT